jgi:beta-mannosidase
MATSKIRTRSLIALFIFLTTIVSIVEKQKCFAQSTTIPAELVFTNNWNLTNSNKNISVTGVTIPNGVHTILYSKGFIENPIEPFNDLDQRWISNSEDGWLFETNFALNNSYNLTNTLFSIELNSIDTIATVYLNDRYLLFCKNQFLKYRVNNINSKLRAGMNNLKIDFKSPTKYAVDLAKFSPYPVPQTCPPPEYNGECQVNFIRKQRSSFFTVRLLNF